MKKHYYKRGENGELIKVEEDYQPEADTNQPQLSYGYQFQNSDNGFNSQSEQTTAPYMPEDPPVAPPVGPSSFSTEAPPIVPPADTSTFRAEATPIVPPRRRKEDDSKNNESKDVFSTGFGSSLDTYNDASGNLNQSAYGRPADIEVTRRPRDLDRTRAGMRDRVRTHGASGGITPRFGHRMTTIYLICLLGAVALIALSIWLHSIGYYIGF